MSNRKVILITGSSRGIGKSIAHFFLKNNYSVVINGTSAQRVQSCLNEFKTDFPDDVIGFAGDITDEDFVIDMFNKTLKRFNQLNVLINNAGITKDALMMRMKISDWEDVMNVNLKGSFLCSKAAIRPMLKAGSGTIINITSVVGQMGNPGQANYSTSKGGMISFTKSIARELAAKNIRVNAIAPGFIETDMTKEMNEKSKEILMQNIPLKKLGKVEDIAQSALFLASDNASYITGQVIAVNGGLYM